MTPDLDRIRSRHANALANRERGVIDSRDDDIGVLLGEVERLQCESDYYRSAVIQRTQSHKPSFVPKRIRLPVRISGDYPIGHLSQAGPGDFECHCNQWGAISVTAENGKLLGVKLDECSVLEWRPNP